jgi:hypothetical protein
MSYAALGGTSLKGRTTYRRVTFERADLREANPGSADFLDCDFASAKLTKVEFNGNGLLRCRFAGLLNEVIFSKNPVSGDTGEGVLEDVDFSEARLRWCSFRGYDLKSVRLPNSANHIVFRNYPCVLRGAISQLQDATAPEDLHLLGLLEHEMRWVGPHQRAGVLAIPDLGPGGRLGDAVEARAHWLRTFDAACEGEETEARRD